MVKELANNFNQRMFKVKKHIKSKDEQIQPTPTYNTPQSATDLRKTIKALERMYESEQQKRIQAQKHLEEFKERSIFIEKQFHLIIDKYKNIPRNQQNSKFHDDIENIYKEILKNFDKSNVATHSYLQNKYQNSNQFMERRVDQIASIMGEQLKKHAKLSKESYQKITKEVRVALEGAIKVQELNVNLSQKLKSLEFNNKILREERSLLIHEIVEKKQTIKELSEKYQHFEKSIQQQSIRDESSEDHFGEITLPKPLIKVNHKILDLATLDKQDSKSLYRESKTAQNIQRPSTPRTPTSIHFHAQLNVAKEPQNKKSLHSERFSGRRKNSMFNKMNASSGLQIGQKNLLDPTLLKPKFNMSALAFHSKQMEKCKCQAEKSKYEQTIEHLNKALRRFKNKAYQMQKLLVSYQMKNKQINDALEEAIKQSYEKIEEQRLGKAKNNNQSSLHNTPSKLELILKSEKLFENLKMIKRRLSMLEFPGSSCGWGDLGNLY